MLRRGQNEFDGRVLIECKREVPGGVEGRRCFVLLGCSGMTKMGDWTGTWMSNRPRIARSFVLGNMRRYRKLCGLRLLS